MVVLRCLQRDRGRSQLGRVRPRCTPRQSASGFSAEKQGRGSGAGLTADPALKLNLGFRNSVVRLCSDRPQNSVIPTGADHRERGGLRSGGTLCTAAVSATRVVPWAKAQRLRCRNSNAPAVQEHAVRFLEFEGCGRSLPTLRPKLHSLGATGRCPWSAHFRRSGCIPG